MALLYSFLCMSIYSVGFCHSQPEVRITQGIVRGTYKQTVSKRLVASFEGIPYAKPPVGKLRFEAPVQESPWTGIYEATKPPPMCIQFQYGLFSLGPEKVLGTEDCLYINVYTPQVPSAGKQKLLDVIAFIHGGGFTVGKSWDHGPSLLLEKDLVLVTFNYRLGPIGFLSTEDSVVPGNNGLKDQALALNWIQQNIAAFGGNPKSVTIGGLSAGGASCGFHLLSPLSKGLYKGALCMSGVVTNPWALTENSREKTQVIAADLDCPTSDTSIMIDCLKSRPAKQIVNKLNKFMYKDSYPFAPFGPVVEPVSTNAFISDLPINILKEKKGSDVPVIFSYVIDEGALFIGKPEIQQALKNHWDDLIHYILDYNYTVQPERKFEINKKIKEYYKIDVEPDNIQHYTRMGGDRMFVGGISKLVKITAAHYNSPVYLYRFSYRGKMSLLDLPGLGNKQLDKYPTHGDDSFYTIGLALFNNLNDESDIQLTHQMQDLWVSFAANGTLGENWQPVQEQLPRIVYTDIRGPGDFKLTIEDELGEESFWDSLNLNENTKSSTNLHEEL